ncbi:Ig-like domain-containing protein [Pantoea sp. CCBC3-3-1]|uniref:Ig-like domain-containing protein n=1 Tax=Pantoea sp. CCBC3-3-1 TaxID=2490851 RepID=UPI0011BFB2CD|nr:Ig-like domain-containing protein [Pantoea sp. CCBC3-3-1]
MAQLTDGSVDILSRDDGRILSQAAAGNSNTVLLNQPSVVRIHGTRAMVSEFERQGNDLIVHMRDGQTVRYQQFFFDDVDGDHSELVFDDGVNPPEHALFPVTSEFADAQTAMAIAPEYESLGGLDPLLLADTGAGTGVITAAGIGALGLAGLGIGALANGGGGGGGGGGGTALVTPTIGVNTFAGDDIVSAAEKGVAQTLSGTTTGTEAGNTITIVLNGVTYTTTIAADGTWNVTIPAADLAALPTGNNTLSLSVTNNAGTTATTSDTIAVEASTVQPGVPTIAIAAFAGDDVLNAAEQQTAQTVSGTTTNVQQGQTVTVTLGGQTYTATVGADGTWSVAVPATALQALAAGASTIGATVTDTAGVSADATHNFTVEALAGTPAITIAAFAGDDVLDTTEQQAAQTISGATANVPQGQTVTVTLNGQTYTATVGADGTWSVSVPATALQALAAGTTTINASITDAAGATVTTTHDFTVAAAGVPTVAIDAFAGDDLLDGAEKLQEQTLSGTTTNVEQGQTVTVTLNGVTYTATVDANGAWSVAVPATALQALAAGTATITADVTNVAGTPATATHDFTVESSDLSSISINQLSGDGYLNITEAQSDLTVSGFATGIPAGTVIRLTLHGRLYSTTVNDDGSWSTTIPAADLQDLPQGSNLVIATATLADGTLVQNSTASALEVITIQPNANVNVPFGDAVLNSSEAGTAQTLAGNTGVTGPGQTIVATVGGTDYTGTVNNDGSWTVSIPPEALQGLPQGSTDITVVVTDPAGNSTTSTTPVNVVTVAPASTVLLPDAPLNQTDVTQPLTISGVSDGSQNIAVTLNGITYTTTVNPDGSWSVNIPASDLQQIASGDYPVTVTNTDSYGNSNTQTSTLSIATTPPTATVDTISGDGYVNAGEFDLPLNFTGTTQPGNTVVVRLDGVDLAATVDPTTGAWTAALTDDIKAAIADGTYVVTVVTTDAAGNSSEIYSSVTFATTQPIVTVNALTADGILNGAEVTVAQTLTGTATNVQAGREITLTLADGSTFTGTVEAGGGWSILLPAATLSALANGTQSYSVTVSDAAGNTSNTTGSFDVAVDNSVATLAVGPISGDNALNATEAQSDLVIGGSSAGLAATTPLTVTFNGVDYTSVVNADGTWTVTVPAAALTGLANGNYTVAVTGTDAGNNPVTSESQLAVRTTFPTPADITLNSPFGDGALNAAETATPQTLSGNSGTTAADQTVTVNIGGVDYPATVNATTGDWSLTLLPEVLQSLPNGSSDIIVTVTDSLGNTVNSTTPVTVDTAPPALDAVTVGDGSTINSQTQNQPLAVSGTAEAGSTVSVVLDGVTYLTGADDNGNWSLNISPSTLQSLPDGKYDVTVTATDAAGNQTSSLVPITISTVAPVVTVAPVSGDGYLNAAEHAAALSVAGTADAGSAVVVSLNGVTYNTVSDAAGNWSVEVPADAVNALTDGTYGVNVQVTNPAGNSSSTLQPLTVVAQAASQPTITVAAFAGDNVLDGAEKGLNQLVTGTTTNVAAGQPVTLTLNGQQYTGTVQSDGSYSIEVPATAYYALANGAQNYTVAVSDTAGNPATTSSTFTVDNTFSAIAIGIVSNDNMLSAAEAQTPLVISGSSRFVAFGARILMRFNSVDYETTANADGSWSVTVPASALAGLANGSQTITATATDINGNTITTTQALDSAVTPDFNLTLNPPFVDGSLNGIEATSDQPLSGNTGVTGTGQTVSVVLGGITYTGTVDTDGNWSVLLPNAVLQALPQGSNDLNISVTDPSGNATSLTTTFTVDTLTPTLTLDAIAQDNRLNLAEQNQTLTVSGNGEEGDTVSVQLNGNTYTGTVTGTGSWNIDIPSAALLDLAEGSYNVTVSVTDAVGNVSTVIRTLDVDLTPPAVTVNTVSGDGYLNAAESNQPLVVSGTGETGSTISVDLNNVTYTTVVGANGQWTLTVPNTAVNGLADGSYTLNVTASDQAGNTTVTTTPLTVSTSVPVINVNDVTDNNVVDGAEQQTDQIISGTTTNVEVGQQITVTLDGVDYTTAILAGGGWQVTIPAAALTGLANGAQTLTVSVTDVAGNSSSVDKAFTVDNTLSSVAFDPLSADGYLNAQEAQTDLSVTGTTTNVAEGSTVTFTLGGQTYTGTVAADGSWTVTVPAADLQALAEGPQTATASVTANSGVVTSESTLDVYIDRVPDPTLQTPFTDGTLTNDEAGITQTLNGTTGQTGDGQTVTVNIGGTDYTATVNSSGLWSLDLSPAILQALPQGQSAVTVTVTDVAGNTSAITPAPTITVATTLPALTVDPLAGGDGIINADEQGNPLTVSGTGTAGDTVNATLNGEQYSATVNDDGSWTITVPAADLAALADGPYALQLSVTDAFGNTTTQNLPLSVDTATPTFTVDPIATDNIIDLAEQGQGVDVTGTGTAGDTIAVTLGGDTFNATVGADGVWTVSVPATTLTNLTEGDNTVTVSATSAAGNTASQDTTVVLDTAIDVGLIVNTVAGDDIVNATEAVQGFNVTGSVPDATTAVVVTFNGTSYPATVGANGLWTAAIPASALDGLADGDYLVSVTATPATGGAITVPATITLDTALPTFTVAAVSGDSFLNTAEQGQPLDITGTGTAGDSVRVTLNGSVYTATVDADGNWTVTVPDTALIALTNGSYPLNVTVTDPAGNTATQSSTLAVDLTAPLLTVNPLSGDNILNAEEQSQPLTVSGTAENGAAITVTLEGVDYTATAAANGQWSVAIPTADLLALTNGDYTLTVTATDAAGNTTTQDSTLTVVADANTLPVLTVDNFAGNNILDGAEQQVNQELSGTTTNVQPGQLVSVTLNGVTYIGTVQASGAWSITVPAADLVNLPSGSTQSYVVSVGDAAGNPATVSGSFDVNTDLSAIALDPISEDGYLNAIEAQSDLTLSGTASNLPEGNTVTVTLNGVDYTATIQNGAWSLVVPAVDLAALPDGVQTVTVSATDAGDNTVTSDATLNVAIATLPTAVAATPFTDGTLNADEAATAQTLTGTTGVTGDGQAVSVVINGQTYTGTVDGDGNWSLVLPASVLQSLPQGDTTALVTVSDAAGNTSTSDLTLSVDTLPPAVTVADIAGDNTLNAAEQGSDLPLSGTGEADSAIVVSLNGVNYTATVGGDGQWTLTIPAADLANLADGDYVVNTTATDPAGNSTTVESPLTVKASAAGLPTISVDPFASDDTINGAEQQTTQYLTGTTTNVEAGQQLTVTLNGVAYFTRVLASGAWRVAIPSTALAALEDGTSTFSISVADAAGNPVTTTRDITVDAGATGISIDPLSTDGYLNAVEAQDALIVTGTTVNIAQGTPVTVTFNGQTFTGAVGADGTWNAIIPASSLAGLPDGAATLTVAVTDAGGTTIISDGTLNVQVNQLPLATADAPFNDGVLNGSEAATAQTLTGTTGLTGDGQIVTVVVGGITYTGVVDANGNWSVSVPAADLQALPQGGNTLQVTVADAAGNTNVLGVPVIVDTVAPTVTLNTIAGDGIVNAGEAAAEITVSGTSTDAEAGQLVTVSLAGQNYTTAIAADGSWTLQLPAGLLQTAVDGTYPLTATLSDAAGNSTTATSDITLSTVSLQPTLDTPFTNNYLNTAEAQADQTLSGTTGATGAGQTVTVNIGGIDYSAAVDANGGWTLPVTAATLQALGEGIQTVTVTAADAQGNTGTASTSITVDYTAPTLTVDPVAGDNIINAAESLQPVTIGGTASLSEVGQLVTVTFNGTAYQQTVQNDGSWLINLPSNVVQGLADGAYPVTVSLTDSAGNVSTQDLTVTVDAAAASLPVITLDAVTGDNYINQIEAGQDLIVTGNVTNVTEGQTVTVTLNSLTYTTLVQADGTWSATIPAADLATLPDGAQNISAAVADAAGNPASVTSQITVIAQAADLPAITINPITSDDVVNNQEAQDDLQISGTSQRIPAGDTVTVTMNGNAYVATVDADGNWTTTVPAADVQALSQGTNTVTASGNDVAGNVATSTVDFTVDTVLPVLSVATSAGVDNVLNVSEAEAGLVVSGTTDAGLPVTVTLNNKTYSATAAADGTWSLTIDSGDLLALADGQTPLTVAVTDASGNTATSDLSLGVAINALPTLTLDTPFTDGLVNAAEAGADQILTGSATNLAEGTAITVTVEGLTFAGVVNADGTWSTTIPAGSLTGLGDGAYQLAITTTDAAGNPASASGSIELLVAPLPAITIATPFVDGLLNATEAGVDQLINGNTGITGAGQTVTLNIDGNDITATVDESGVWSATLTPTLAATLGNGDHTITVNVADRAGNTSTDSLVYTAIVTGLPDPTLVQPFTDGVLNAAEAAAGGTLDGTTGITGAQTVTVDINGTAYTPVVDPATGAWSLDLPAGTLTTLPDGTLPITVTVTDAVGNVASATDNLVVAVNTLPATTIDLPFGDGQLNVAEAAITQTVSGNTGITGAGQTVAVTIDGGAPLTATVNANGNWTLDLTTDQLTALSDGTHTFAVTATDSAGNASTATLDFNALLTLPQPTVDGPLFTDGFLNIAEAGAAITLTGTTGVTGANQGVQLQIDLDGIVYTGTVAADGTWAVPLPAGALNSLDDGAHSVNVTVIDAAGNTNTSSLDFTSLLTPPVPALAVPFDNSYMNGDDVAAGAALTGTTGVAGDGQTVIVTIGATNYPATVATNGAWTLDLNTAQLNALGEGLQNVTVVATDAAGNSATVAGSFTVDTIAPVVNIDPFTGDNALDYAESLTTQLLTGTSTGASEGQIVTVTIGTASVEGVVAADGSWSVNLTPVQLAQLGTTGDTGTITASIADIAGNAGTATTDVTVDLTPPPTPLLSLNPISGDNVVNSTDGATLTVSGTFANLPTTGGAVTGTVAVTINGVAQAATSAVVTADGIWTITVPNTTANIAEGTATVTATLTTDQGTTLTSSSQVLVDRIVPTVTVNTFAGDDVLNNSEAATSQTITGTASVSEAGRAVTVTLNAKTYTAFVQGDGSWSTTVGAGDLQALAQSGQTISATLTDAAGNVGTTTHDFTVDTGAPLIQVDALLGDNLLNATDILTTQVLTGTASGAEGQTIGLYVGDSSPIATAIVNADGTFSLDLTPEVLGSLTDGALVFGLRVSDAAGNATDATLTVNKVVNAALNLVVDTVFGDGFLNAADTAVAQTITGVASSAGVGATVSLTLGGTTVSAAVGQDGRFALVVPPSLLGLLSDGNTSLNLVLTDAAGNTRTVGETVTAILEAPVINAITGLFGGDNLLNIAEAAVAQTIGGTINGTTGSTVTVTLGSKSYQTTLQAGGAWSISVPALDLAALTTGNQTLGVTVVDPAGNVSSTSTTLGIFTAQPTITLSPIFGDGILNVADALVNQTISGTVNNVAAGSIVTLTLGNASVQATVGQNGTFTATVTPAILSTLTDGNLTVGASVTDAAGNTATASSALLTKLTAPVVSIAQLFGDGLLNLADAALGQNVTGTITGAEAGSRVVVTVAGTQFVTTTAANGAFSVALTPAILKGLADGNLTVGVSVTDAAGNTSSATAGAIVGVHTLPAVTLNPLFGDGVLNLAESLVTQTISGTATNVAAGSTVTIALGNTTVTAVVGQNGAYSAQVSPAILSTLLDGNLTASVSVTDAVGNVASTSAGLKVGIHTTPTLTVNTVFGDSVLSANDLSTVQTISGTARNVAAGSIVTVTLNNVTYTATVNSSGGWTLNVPKADLSALPNTVLTVNASVTDSLYGNTATNTGTLINIAQTPPSVTISSIFGDGLLNAVDATAAQTINGTTTNAEGSILTVRVGTATLTTTVGANGTWSVSVPAATLAALADGTSTVTASVTNYVGNTGSGTDTVVIKTHTLPTVAITNSTVFGGDHYLNLSEANVAETISGTSTNAVGSTVSVNVAGNVYTTTVGSNGAWSITIPSATLRSLADGSYTINATVTDTVGNTSTGSNTFTAKTNNLPIVGVDPVLSLVSVLVNGLTISGGTLNLAQGTTVNVTLNGTTQTATLDALGRYSTKFTGGLLTTLSLNSIVTVTAVDVAGNPANTSTTLLLGSLLPTTTTSAVAATTLLAVAADDATAVAAADNSDTTTAQAATAARVATTSETSDTDSSTVASTTSDSTTTTDDTTTTATAATSDDSGYTIGGLVIAFADGHTAEGASVTGGTGDDTITLNTTNFTHIDGGAGTDTLVLNGENMTLDLTSLGLKVEHIEVINLGSSGTNSIKLDLNEALNITDSQSNDLVIKGVTGDQVTLANGDGGVWATTAQRTVDGQVYDVYHNSALASTNTLGDVLIQHALQVHVV